jgi:hypothetical protein
MTRFLTVAAAVLAGALALSAPAFAACSAFNGSFTAVPPGSCGSPVGICTHGTLVGGFPSTYDFTMDTLTATTSPGVSSYTGHSLLSTPTGTLTGSDRGVLVAHPDGTASFVTVVQIVGGTGAYSHARGVIVAPGTLSFATGATVGSYAGAVCT